MKNKSTLNLYNNIEACNIITNEESIMLHDADFQRSFLLPKYRGIYLNRSILLNSKEVVDIYNLPIENNQLSQLFSSLYPENLQEELTLLKNLDEEIEMLEGIYNKTLDINQKKINYRNNDFDRDELPTVILQAKAEAKVERDKIESHDRLCRNVHYSAAKIIGNGWSEYLFSITSLVHFCEHTKNKSNFIQSIFTKRLPQVLKSEILVRKKFMSFYGPPTIIAQQ